MLNIHLPIHGERVVFSSCLYENVEFLCTVPVYIDKVYSKFSEI